jgi:Uma2 family endonuclease
MIDPIIEMTPEEYLEFERASAVRHEYVRGEVHLLAGARNVHTVIVQNASGLLLTHLAGSPCQLFGSDTKLRTEAGHVYYYPDLMVQCEPFDLQLDYIEQPRYVIEVSSPSTRRIDRGEKADVYWRVPSIEAYVMIAQDMLRVLVLRRPAGADATRATDWETTLLTGPESELLLEGIEFACPLADVYARTGLV